MPITDMTKEAGFGTKFGRFENNPIGMIIHHTGGGQNVDDVIKTFKGSNFPAQFIIDRDGKIYQTLPNGYRGQHIVPGTGPYGEGRSNRNMEGVEIIAKDDSDVLPIQTRSAANLVAQRGAMWGYDPKAAIFGHGEVNPPPHRELSEGMSTVSGVRDGTLGLPDYSRVIRPMSMVPPASQVAQQPQQPQMPTVAPAPRVEQNPIVTGQPVSLVPPTWLPQQMTQTAEMEAPGGY